MFFYPRPSSLELLQIMFFKYLPVSCQTDPYILFHYLLI